MHTQETKNVHPFQSRSGAAHLVQTTDGATIADNTGTWLRQPELEVKALATAIRDAALSAGIARSDVPLTGPHLVMLCEHLASLARVEPAHSAVAMTEAMGDLGERRIVQALKERGMSIQVFRARIVEWAGMSARLMNEVLAAGDFKASSLTAIWPEYVDRNFGRHMREHLLSGLSLEVDMGNALLAMAAYRFLRNEGRDVSRSYAVVHQVTGQLDEEDVS